MPCFHPMQAWSCRCDILRKNKIIFSERRALSREFVSVSELLLPCGQCVGCRLERSRQWAVRCVLESRMHERNCFITLTFDDVSLYKRDNPLSLDVRDFQLFMKRFRKKFGNGIRFFSCGEYGDLHRRPHYHACIFGFDFDDRQLHTIRNDIPIYTSKSLESLWPFGYCSVGDVTFESAAYVARYIMKKVTGDLAKDFYTVIDFDTGEVFDLKPEYNVMSRGGRSGLGGIANSWYKEFRSDVYPCDNVVVARDGIEMRPPKYFDGLYQNDNPISLERIKEERKSRAIKFSTDNTPERLLVREKCQLIKLDLLKRSLE